MGIFNFKKDTVENKKGKNKEDVRLYEQDEFKYKPLDNFVYFSVQKDPDDPADYTLIMQIYDANDPENVYKTTENENGGINKHFSLDTYDNRAINEILLKRIKIKALYNEKGVNVNEPKAEEYIMELNKVLRRMSQSINDYVLGKDLITTDKADQSKTSNDKKYITTITEISKLLQEYANLNKEDYKLMLGNKNFIYPFICENMPDGDAFDECYKNASYNKDKDSLTEAEKEEMKKSYPYDMNHSKEFKIRKKFKRVFSNSKREYGSIVEVPPTYKDTLKSNVWPPEKSIKSTVKTKDKMLTRESKEQNFKE